MLLSQLEFFWALCEEEYQQSNTSTCGQYTLHATFESVRVKMFFHPSELEMATSFWGSHDFSLHPNHTIIMKSNIIKFEINEWS